MSDPSLAVFQSLSWCSRCIDDDPVDCTDVVFLLKPGDLGRGVGRIALAATDAVHSGRKVGYEKEAGKRDTQLARGIVDLGPFLFMRKHCVHHDGMALGNNPDRTLHQGLVNLFGDFRSVCALGQSIRFIDFEQLLSQHVAAQYDGPRKRRDIRGERARQNGFPGSGQSADRNQRRRRGVDRLARQLEIGPCRLHDAGLVVIVPVKAGEQHKGADSRSHRHEQRSVAVEIFARRHRRYRLKGRRVTP